MKWTRDRVLKVFQLYKQFRSYSKVGREIGLSRERVRQILVRGRDLCWIQAKEIPMNHGIDYKNILN